MTTEKDTKIEKSRKCTGKKENCGEVIQFCGEGTFSCVYYDNSEEECKRDD